MTRDMKNREDLSNNRNSYETLGSDGFCRKAMPRVPEF